MSTPTTNYGLIKAAEGEQYDVDITNNNLDAIDGQMKTEETERKKTRIARFAMINPKPGGPAGNGIVFGPLQAETVWTQDVRNNDFCVADNTGAAATDNGRVRILTAGCYDIQVMYLPSADPGSVNVGLLRMSDKLDTRTRNSTYGDREMTLIATGTWLNVGDLISMYVASSTGVSFGCWIKISQRST